MRGARMSGEDWADRDLRGANLVMANLEAVVLDGARLADAHLHGCRLRKASLARVDLSNIKARDADFESANLLSAALVGADLRGAVLFEANLRGADLRGANLRGADLRRADLTGANLNDAVLDDADLAGALLDDATADGASARGARIRWTQGDLVEALRQAGAQSRPPLAVGRLAALVAMAVGALAVGVGGVLRIGIERVAPTFRVVLRRLDPLLARASAVQAMVRAAWGVVQRLPALLRARARTGLKAGAQQSQELASRVRTEVQQRLRTTALERQARREAEEERRIQARAAAAAKVQERLPGGPGASLVGRDFRGARLSFAVWTEADLTECTLDGANLDKADLRGATLVRTKLVGTRLRDTDLRDALLNRANCEGARMRAAILTRASAQHGSFIDADLRHADLQGTDFTGANLSGADLRGARLRGVIFRDADLSGARLPDVDLVDAILDGARLTQADVAGVRWSGTRVADADFTGVLGLGTRERDLLRERGARVDELHLERLLGRLGARPIQVGTGILALGMISYLAARFAGEDVINPAQLEVAAQDLRGTDPNEASKRYVELADVARRAEDRVGYLVEAALMAEASGDLDQAEALFNDALEAAEDLPQAASETRLRMAVFLNEHQRWADSLKAVEPLVSEVDQPTEQRARAMVLYDQNRLALGVTDASARELVFSSMGDLSETQADLHVALAELYTNSGDTTAAMQEIEQAESLDVPEDLRIRLMETRARTQDRSGDHEGAIRTWTSVLNAAANGSIASQAAPLAIADLHLRQGRTEDAVEFLSSILETTNDDRIRGRALLVQARIAEKENQQERAIDAYRAVIAIAELDAETLDEARISLAAVVLSNAESPAATTMLKDLAPEALAEVMAHAKLGEARQLLDAGNATEARPIYASLAADADTPETIQTAAKAGLGESLAQMGELRDALDLWRELLAKPTTTQDRLQLELLVANGLLQGGKRQEATTAFRSLADAENKETRVQGLLGLAEVARSSSERARARSLYRQVADQQVDAVWKVRALQELSDMATEDGDIDEAVALSRELVGALPPGHISAPEARLSLISALGQFNALDEALGLCTTAINSAPNPAAVSAAQIVCAEVRERAQDWQAALDSYRTVIETAPADDVRTDAALGIARCAIEMDQPTLMIQPLDRALNTIATPALRLPLLSMQMRALEMMEKPIALAAARAERDALAEQIPEVAWMAFVEAAGQERTAGRSDLALANLQQALALPITNRQRATVLVELGAALVDVARLEEAQSQFELVLDVVEAESPEAFYAGMGLAEIERRRGRPRLALEQLTGLSPPDEAEYRSLLAARATALSEAQDEGAENAWEELAALAGEHPDARFTALKGQADALLAAERPAQALPLYIEAKTVAKEPWQRGWAGIGMASAMSLTDDLDGAATVLDELVLHGDPEVRLEASLRRSQLAAEQQDWTTAVRSLNPQDAIDLGPAWDASATTVRAQALLGAGDTEGAEAAWRALARRWPNQEEATLPAWLGLAQLSIDAGDNRDAHYWARKAFKEARDPGYKSQAEAMVTALKDN